MTKCQVEPQLDISKLTPKSVDPRPLGQGPVIGVVLDVQADQGVEKAQQERLPKWITRIFVHVKLQQNGSAPNESRFKVIMPWRERLQSR